MKIFSKESLKHSGRMIIVIVLVCLVMWIWGRHRTVRANLTMYPEIRGDEMGSHIDITVFRDDENGSVEATFSAPMEPHVGVRYPLSIAPGTYYLQGTVTTPSGRNHVVRQTIVVPDSDAAITLYLRE